MKHSAAERVEPTYESLLADPTTHLRGPREVLRLPTLTARQKRSVLERWLLDAERLENASNEGMTGGEPSLLREVHAALAALEGERKARAVSRPG